MVKPPEELTNTQQVILYAIKQKKKVHFNALLEFIKDTRAAVKKEPMAASTLARQLKILKERDLVSRIPKGSGRKEVYYKLNVPIEWSDFSEPQDRRFEEPSDEEYVRLRALTISFLWVEEALYLEGWIPHHENYVFLNKRMDYFHESLKKHVPEEKLRHTALLKIRDYLQDLLMKPYSSKQTSEE